jgi:hypothetical protein
VDGENDAAHRQRRFSDHCMGIYEALTWAT